MTPEEFADFANNSGLDERHDFAIKKFLRDASAKDIQRFIHQLNTSAQPAFFKFASVALDIRLAEDSEKTTRRIVWLTWGLIILTFALLAVTIALYYDSREQIQRGKFTNDGSIQNKHPPIQIHGNTN